jgi:predicted DCC family thiol-disulfide oxidoreductase YuxK
MIKVFYDGKCGLCSREIRYYKRIAPENIFEWIDITTSTDILVNENLDYNDTLKLLHTKDSQEKLFVGLDSFILIWQQLKYWKILATIVSLPIIKQIINLVYKTFASWRFKRLSYCKITPNKGEKK